MPLLARAWGALAALLLLSAAAAAQAPPPKDGTSNTIVLGERPVGATGCTAITTYGPAGDGTSSTFWTWLYLRPTASGGATCGFPIAAAPCPIARTPIGSILDGTSNTIYVGGTSGASCLTPIGDGRCAVRSAPGLIGDGTSNTLLIGALLPPLGAAECALPIGQSGCALGQPGTVADGTSNTIFLGALGTGFGCLLPVAGTQDLPDVRATPDGSVCSPTPGGIVDGTSNTIIVGECTAPDAVTTPEPATLALAASGFGALLALRATRRVRRAPLW